jgi:hypothetical protein
MLGPENPRNRLYFYTGKALLLDEVVSSSGPDGFHAKTASITGSVVSSLHSDSSLSCPSSSGLRKSGGPEGSEADSERDSVSPQRQRDEVRKTKNIEQKEGIYV